METSYQECNLCPRNCRVNRLHQAGFCKQRQPLTLALAALHFGEEPPLVGTGGSGTLFFSGCQLACPFCQNHQISRGLIGKEISVEKLATLMLQLEAEGAININLVSATQHWPAIRQAITLAQTKGLTVPFVFNTGGYEKIETLQQLKDTVRIYLPDLKTLNCTTATKLYLTKDYPQKASEGIVYMANNLPLQWQGHILKQGVIMRHLILPGYLDDTYQVLKWYKENLEGKAILSLLTQYTPVFIAGEQREIPNRYLNKQEEEQVLVWLNHLNIEDGFFQDLIPGNSWLPNFQNPAPFKAGLAKTLWHT